MSYQKYADKAFSKIQEKGSPITVKRAGKKIYNPATNKYADSGIELNGYACQFTFDQKDINGTNIKFADVKFMAVLDGRPLSNDTITFEGKSYTIVDARPLNIDGKTDIYYTIQAR